MQQLQTAFLWLLVFLGGATCSWVIYQQRGLFTVASILLLIGIFMLFWRGAIGISERRYPDRSKKQR